MDSAVQSTLHLSPYDARMPRRRRHPPSRALYGDARCAGRGPARRPSGSRLYRWRSTHVHHGLHQIVWLHAGPVRAMLGRNRTRSEGPLAVVPARHGARLPLCAGTADVLTFARARSAVDSGFRQRARLGAVRRAAPAAGAAARRSPAPRMAVAPLLAELVRRPRRTGAAVAGARGGVAPGGAGRARARAERQRARRHQAPFTRFLLGWRWPKHLPRTLAGGAQYARRLA